MTIDLDHIVAIDIHTHAEEPCGIHPDDGYDDFQAAMTAYFKSPHPHPPTVPETAAYYRERRIACVIFPLDAERETGFRRYANEEMAELAGEFSDIMIPFASIDPAKGRAGAREARRLVEALQTAADAYKRAGSTDPTALADALRAINTSTRPA